MLEEFWNAKLLHAAPTAVAFISHPFARVFVESLPTEIPRTRKNPEEHREILYIVVINGTDNRRTLFHGRTARSQTPGKPKTPCFHLSCQESLPGCHQGMAVSQPVNSRGSRRCCSSNRWMNCLELLWLTLGRLRKDKCADPRKDSSVNRGHSLNVSFYRSKDLVFNL